MDNLIAETEKHVIHLLNEKLNSNFVYHNLAHTQLVVEKVKELSDLSKLSDSEKEQLIIAAWFHDTGFTESIDKHEQKSAVIAEAFLKK